MLLTAFSVCLFGQTEAEYEKQYQQRIKEEMINGVYIPRNFDEAFVELERLSPQEGINKFRSASEEVITSKLHFGLGRWILVNWV